MNQPKLPLRACVLALALAAAACGPEQAQHTPTAQVAAGDAGFADAFRTKL